MAYRDALPPRLVGIYYVLYISVLRIYIFDPSHVIDFTPLELGENLSSYKERLVQIFSWEVKELCN